MLVKNFGAIKKKHRTWYRIDVTIKADHLFPYSVVDVVETEHGEWCVMWSYEPSNDKYDSVSKPNSDSRYVFSKLLAAKAFAKDWADFIGCVSDVNPTSYDTDNDKYIDLDVFGRKSEYYKKGMFAK